MARLTDNKLLKIFELQRALLERLDEATNTEFKLLEQYGETEETIPELDELQNIRERANTYYSRFYTTLRQIYLAQPAASYANLEMLENTIADVTAVSEATSASVQEIKRNWNLT